MGLGCTMLGEVVGEVGFELGDEDRLHLFDGWAVLVAEYLKHACDAPVAEPARDDQVEVIEVCAHIDCEPVH